MKRFTKEDFVTRAREVHGSKYDYSKVDYIDNSKKVIIICPEHGEFEQVVRNHLIGKGCPSCKRNNLKKVIHGKYYNDYEGKIWDNNSGKMIQSYIHWLNMIKRCENKEYQDKYPTYIGSTMCHEWWSFKNFKEWFDKNYIEGWHLDKDLIVKGNKVYSPATCCMLPPEINTCLTTNKKNRGKCLIGVYEYKKGKFASTYHREYLGVSKNQEDLFFRYKEKKEAYLKSLAEKYKNKISNDAYNALYMYQIDIND